MTGDARKSRTSVPRRIESESAFEQWLEFVSERSDPFMTFLGVLFALLVGYELAVDLRPETARVISFIGWTIWALFLAEFLVELYLAPRRLRFVRRHWFRVIRIVIPTLRLLSFVRLLRVGRALPAARVLSSSYRVSGAAAKVFRSRLGYLAALTVIAIVAVAELAFVFERDGPSGGVFDHLGEAFLWSAGVVVGQQGDPVPLTAGARLAMVAGFAFGVVVLASLAGALGALFVEQRNERAAATDVNGAPVGQGRSPS